ncbi:FG-GAP repeat protein [Gemmata sp. G18]|uniref:FG-GAP repeat protein n=1 Tax=Gemmata palustris TaxID=2822762 RepID=A0ABS5BJT0_9BACT|nr:FG-GAP-like repeat-containing protein [Gemmata palustris]MBP3953965.1 FG-GAP repeat protein [Gemmata palustris]
MRTDTRLRAHRPRAGTTLTAPALRLETLEPRDVPAILIQFDYSYDTSGFFASHADARAVLERAATDLGNSLTANLAAINPSGSNSWTATFFNPSGSGEISLSNLSIGANTLKVFVGTRTTAGSEAGVGGPGGYRISGSTAWSSSLLSRGHSGYAPWGGSLSFDTSVGWYFGQSASGLTSNKADFYTAATHELGHLLGIGTAPQWTALVSGSTFRGAQSMAAYGGAIPLYTDGAHWADGVTVGGKATVMDPILPQGLRVAWSALDAAALRDLGWNTTAASTPEPTVPPIVRVPVAGTQPIAFTGNADGTVSLFTVSNGVLTDTGTRLTPFVGYRGAIRVASGDFNGDGVTDYAFTTGAGPQTVVEIVNGADGSLLMDQTIVFQGFTGGLFLAAGDIDRDGIDDLVISADAGAGPHIQTFRVVGGGLQLQSSFFAFDNPAFRGGARVAVGDINRDGYADVVVTTGGQAIGRVAVYSGSDLRRGAATRLIPDFIPFAGLWTGLNAAVGDMDGDGYAELAISPDRGGPAHVKIWSGATLTAGSSVQASALPLTASFYAFPPTDPSGARLALRDTNGDGRDELFAASGNRLNSVARVFSYEQAVAGGAGAPTAQPFSTTVTYDGLYAGLHLAPATTSDSASSETTNSGDEPYTVTIPPVTHKCMCGACAALAALTGTETGAAALFSSVPVK